MNPDQLLHNTAVEAIAQNHTPIPTSQDLQQTIITLSGDLAAVTKECDRYRGILDLVALMLARFMKDGFMAHTLVADVLRRIER